MKQTPFDLAELCRKERELRRTRSREWDLFVQGVEHPQPSTIHKDPDTARLRSFMRIQARGLDRHSQLIRTLQIYFDRNCPDLSLTPQSGLITPSKPTASESHNWHGRDDLFEVRAQRQGSREARELQQLMRTQR